MALLENPALTWLLPVPMLLAAAALLWRVFGDTWREVEADAQARRDALREAGEIDWRPAVAMVLGVFVLGLQHKFGGRTFYDAGCARR